MNGQFSKEYSVAFKCAVLARQKEVNSALPSEDEDLTASEDESVIKIPIACALDKVY